MTVAKDDATKISDATTVSSADKTYFVSDNCTVTVNKDTFLIVGNGVTLTLKGTAGRVATIAIGSEKTDGSFEYDSETMFQFTVNTGDDQFVTTKADGDEPGYYAYTKAGSNNGSVLAGVTVTTKDVRIYSLNADGVKATLRTNPTTDNVTVVAPAKIAFETDVTVNFTSTAASENVHQIVIKATGTATKEAATDLKVGITAATGMLNVDDANNRTYTGSIQVVKGTFQEDETAGTNTNAGGLGGLVDGIDLRTTSTGYAHTWYPQGTDIKVADTGDGKQAIVLSPGFEATEKFVIKTSTKTLVSIPENFKVNDMKTGDTVLITRTLAGVTVTGGVTTDSQVTYGKNWDGTMTVSADALIGAGRMGDITMSGSATLGTSAAGAVLMGEVDLAGAMTLSHDITIATGGSIDQGTDYAKNIICNNHKITVNDGVTVSMKILTKDATSENATKNVILSGVIGKKVGSTQFSIASDSAGTTVTLAGGYSAGSITAGSAIAVVKGVGEIYDLTATDADLQVSATGTLRANGEISVKSVTTTTSGGILVFAGKTVKVTETSAVSGSSTITISEGTIMTLGSEVTLTSSGALNVLGQITGGTVSGTAGTNVFTQNGAISGHILSTYASTGSNTAWVAKVETGITTQALLENAIDLGFRQITVSGTLISSPSCTGLEVTADLDIPAGVTVTIAAGAYVVVDAEKALNVEGTLTMATGTGRIVLMSPESTSKTVTLLNNSGTVTAPNGIKVPERTMVINSGAMTIGKNTSGTDNDSSIIGSFENSGVLNLGSANTQVITIGNGSVETEFENNGTINAGTTEIVVSEKATLINNGTIDAARDSAAKISGKGTFYNGADGTVGIAVNTQYVTGYTSTMTIAQDMTQKITYMSLQTLEIPEGADLKLTNVADTIVNGKFVINGTLTIYGTLRIQAADSAAKAAELVVNGDIVIAKGGELIIGSSVPTEGKGNLTISSGASVTVQDGGTLTFNKGYNTVTGSLTMDEGSTLSIASAAAPTVYGTADLNGYISGTAYLYNAGIIGIDNGSNDYVSSTGSIYISMAADGAIVNMDSFLVAGLNSTLTITDAYLYTYYDLKDDSKSKYIPSANSDVITIGYSEVTETGTSVTPTKVVVDGTLVVKQSASYKNVYASSTATSYSKAQTYSMDVSGAIAGDIRYSSTVETVQDKIVLDIETAGTQYFDAAATKKVAENTGSIVVSDELSIDEYVYTTIKTQDVDKKGVFTVSGSIVNNLSGAQQMVVDRDATLTVTGEVVSSNVIDDSSSRGTINAVYHQTVFGTGKDKVTTHYYTTLDKAIEGVQAEGSTAAKQVTIYGTAVLTEDITLPAAVKMTFNDRNAFLYVGTSDARATLTAEAEIVASKQIEVAGTLTFTDKTKDKTSDTVSDVMYESEDANGYRTYTNVYTAIEQAGASGEEMVINVTKEPGTSRDQKVELDQNLVIPSNVTLVVGDDAHAAGLLLKDGVTLTVDGVLMTSQDIAAESRFAVNALDVEVSSTVYYKSSAVVVNGQLMIADSMDSVTVGDGNASGKATSLIASAPIYGAFYTVDKWYVFSNIDDALAEMEITSEDIKVYGPVVGSDGIVEANDTFDTVTIVKQTFTANDAAKTQTATSLTMNSLTLGDGTSIVMNAAFTGSVIVRDNSVAFTKITGPTVAESDENLVLTGSVSVGTGQSLSVSAGTAYLGSSSIFTVSSGTLKVASGATAIVGYSAVSIAKLNVAGTLEVPANKTLTVGTQLDVTGSVIVAEATASSSAGSLVINGKAYVGMSSSDFKTGAAAVLSGPFTLNTGASIYVASGATIDKDMSSYKSTAFYNNGSLWFTAYANGSSVTMTANKAPITNAVLLGWAKTEGATEADFDTSADAITIGAASKLYSVVETEIYTIIIKADTGIGDLYLNGNIMQKGQIQYYEGNVAYYYNAYVATVSYGTYEVTCKLANGYSGTAVLKDSTGASVSANKFTTPEATDYTDVNFQLTGIEKSGYVQPTEEKKDSGLTVTDYLLIVLVILVVILAVIVALRLMRS